ncbi:hypothetical protein [Nostoc sp.]|uniref:hypothetical protein n=1 Tax=Nostoc sp. TaxID=1180 RepID=UPI002FF85AEF
MLLPKKGWKKQCKDDSPVAIAQCKAFGRATPERLVVIQFEFQGSLKKENPLMANKAPNQDLRLLVLRSL